MRKLSTNIVFILILMFGACTSPKKLVHTPVNQLTIEEERDFKYHFYEGLRLKDEQNYEDSLAEFMKSYAINPEDAGLLFELSLMHYANRDLEQALHFLQNAVRLDPDNLWYNMYLIDLYVFYDEYDKAIEVGEKMLKIYPHKENLYNRLISLHKNQKNTAKAIALYDKLESITGVNEQITFDKIFLYLGDNQTQKAFRELDKLIAKFPLNYNYRILKGDILMNQEKTDEAFEVYNMILEEDPQNPYVLISLADYYRSLNEDDRALDYIIMSLKNDQLDIETKFDMLREYISDILKKDGNLEETENLFLLLIEQYPLEEMAHSYYASFLEIMNRNDEAAKAYESMLAINPKNSKTWFTYMLLYFEQKEYEKAISIAEKGIEEADDPFVLYYYKGIFYEILQDYDNAVKTYTTALSLFKEYEKPELQSDFYAHLGDSYMNLDLKEEAFEAYDQAISHNPENVLALNNYAYYLSIDKRELDKAERMSAKTVDTEPNSSTYLDTYAWIFYQQGNYTLAKFYIERALKNLKDKEGESAGVLYDHYGDILWMSRNNDEKALEYWLKAQETGFQSENLEEKIKNKGWNRNE